MALIAKRFSYHQKLNEILILIKFLMQSFNCSEISGFLWLIQWHNLEYKFVKRFSAVMFVNALVSAVYIPVPEGKV